LGIVPEEQAVAAVQGLGLIPEAPQAAAPAAPMAAPAAPAAPAPPMQ
jgi:hypothetical protein